MEYDSHWQVFLALVRAGLWEQDTQLPDILDVPGWQALRQLAMRHAVGGLLLRGVAHLPEDAMPPEKIRMRLICDGDAIERRNVKAGRVQESLMRELSSAGVPALVQKGSECAKYYAHPGLRESGDIDLYCPRFADACAILPEARLHPDGSAVFKRDDVVVELHPQYYDLRLPIEELPAPPSRTAELLMLSAHIFKHAAGHGVGLKQLCDMARALSPAGSETPEADWDVLQAALSKAGLLRWQRLLCSYLVEDLGLEERCCGPDFRRCNPQALRRIVMRGGNFGFSGRLRQGAKGRSRLVRKGATALSFLGHLPFSIRYAPGEAFHDFRKLAAGNLRHKGK